MKQEEKIAMGLVNIPNGLLEQVSKDGMSMLFGGEKVATLISINKLIMAPIVMS